MSKNYDAIIIGTGQAGPTLAARLTKHNMKVAIIERKLFGGTCVNTGCVPTKTLIESAKAAFDIKNCEALGIVIKGEIIVDIKKIKNRKDQIVSGINQGLKKWLNSLENCDVYEGHASFEDKNHIRINDEIIRGEKIFIDVGTHPRVPNLPGLHQIQYFTNSTIMEVNFVPEHLIILGGSYSGLEFAQMYRRFGSEVTIIEKAPRILMREDEDISDEIKRILTEEGIHIETLAENIAFKNKNNQIQVNFHCGEKKKIIEGSHVLLALGREPNTADLNLEKAGVKTNEKGHILVDDFLQTNIPNIFALGDCNGRGAFTHTAYNDFEIVYDNLLKNEKRKVSDRIVAYALFTDPPLGRAGLTEKEAREMDRKILVAKFPMSKIKRAVIKNKTQGFMKMIVDANNHEILGAAILGAEGDELIHAILDVMYAKAPYTLLQKAVHIHPTIAEYLPSLVTELK